LKLPYTEVLLSSIKVLSSYNQCRLFEILLALEHKGKWETTVENLRGLLHLQNKYPIFSHLKKHCLDKSLARINERTNITVTYTTKREGLKVREIVFDIRKKKTITAKKGKPTTAKKPTNPLLGLGISPNKAKEITDTFSEKDIKEVVHECNQMDRKTVNVAGVAVVKFRQREAEMEAKLQEAVILKNTEDNEKINKKWMDENKDRLNPKHTFTIQKNHLGLTLDRESRENRRSVGSAIMFSLEPQEFIGIIEGVIEKYRENEADG
jgi:hypothetical protein